MILNRLSIENKIYNRDNDDDNNNKKKLSLLNDNNTLDFKIDLTLFVAVNLIFMRKIQFSSIKLDFIL